MTFLLGLTGNIGCGKSAVGQILASKYGADHVDADQVVHTLYAAATPETVAIAARFGQHLLQADGTIDRRRLGDLVMSDAAALRDLEALLQPGIRQAIDARLTASTARVVVLDAIRLIEAGLASRCQTVWVVVCDQAKQIDRLVSSRNLSHAQARLRVSAQRPAAEKVSHATEVLDNDGTLAELEAQIDAAWHRSVAPHLTA